MIAPNNTTFESIKNSIDKLIQYIASNKKNVLIITNKIVDVIVYFLKIFVLSLKLKDYFILGYILVCLCCTLIYNIYNNMESNEVARLIQLNKSIIEKNINFKDQIGYNSLKDNILISNDSYLVLFKEKDYSHYQLQVIKRSDLEELQRKLDSEAAKQAAKPRQSSEKTKKNREKYLIGLYNKKRIGIQYYYRDQNDFIYICQNSNIERSCQRHYL